MDSFEKLREAKELYDQGILTEEEFTTLKAKLLDNMSTGQDIQPAAKAAPVEKAAYSSGIAALSGSASEAPAEQVANVPPATAAAETVITSEEGATTGMKVLSLLIPLAGLILFFMDRDNKPLAAKDELKFAGIGFAIGLVLWLMFGYDSYYYY